MGRKPDPKQSRGGAAQQRTGTGRSPASAPPEALWRSRYDYAGLKLMPWKDVWASVEAARLRGNTEMLKTFYANLFEEAVFDDRGAWWLSDQTRH